MSEKQFKRSYKFALFSALYISIFATIVLLFTEYLFFDISWESIIFFGFLCFCLSFLVIQLRIEHFIYKRVKAVYDSVTLLDSSSLQKQRVTTDMATLTKEVEKFARDKKIEIESLKGRETYRKEFMGNVSHELKTPLFTVQGYILTLLDGAFEDKKVRKKYLKRASKGVDRLIYIVNDLDMITKLESGDLHLYKEKFDLVDVVKSVFELLEMKADKKEITLSFDRAYTPIYVDADKDRIQQVLTNLIVNSVKYGKIGGTTEVSLENLSKNKILVRITDNGEGIANEHIPRLFERFYRVDKSGSRQEGGSGLGLSIVKHIIEAHDENIYVESEYEVGSEFSFTLEKLEGVLQNSVVAKEKLT